MAITLYANMVSQPSRAVAWVLQAKGVDYEHVEVEFGGAFAKSDEFLAMNPNGFVPVLKDGDFTLFEGNAILAYLAEKFQWEDLYPTELQARAKINEYLHWHHTTVRNFTLQVVRPFLRKVVFKAATPQELEYVAQYKETIAKHTAVLEKFFVNDFVARTNHATIADYVAYCEFDQLQAMGLLDLAAFPKTQAWFDRMAQLPLHDEVHTVMNGFMKATGLENVGKKQEEAAVEQATP
ncbi:hypothetical protein PINS_up022194 [Pythium insidiosum]|nr:hypothetical protein PINS_up022194 [Pythium insidiosum]